MRFRLHTKSDVIAGAIMFAGFAFLSALLSAFADHLPIHRIRIDDALLTPDHPEFAHYLFLARLVSAVIALVFATHLIDSQFQFGGVKTNAAQALQWPREGCHDPDADGWAGGTVADNIVPKSVADATCEMARELLIADPHGFACW
jgi:hypothetical protein